MPAQSAKQRIIDDITEKIRTGEITPGAQLPTSPELMAQYGTSLGPVRAAIDRLKAVGLVEFTPGVGVFVVEKSA